MNILITGGAGYIGSHVCKHLLEKTEYTLVIVDNLSTGSLNAIHVLEKIGEGRVVFCEIDLSQIKKMQNIFSKFQISAVMHFAASIVAPESVEKPLDYYSNNTTNALKLFKLCAGHNVKHVIFSSTAAVYGNVSKNNIPISEDVPVSPINPYGSSKLFSECMLQDIAKAYGLNYVILRYFNVAGADINDFGAPRFGQSGQNATHLIRVCSQVALGVKNELKVFGNDYHTLDGTCVRDYIHVDDLALGHLSALEYAQSCRNGVFNLGYGTGYSVLQVIRAMKAVTGVNFSVIDAPRRQGDPEILVASSNKAQELLSWTPQYNDLELICKSAFEWEKSKVGISL